jgi:transposase
MEPILKSEKSKKSKAKRKFTPEFKAEAVKLACSPGQSISELAKDLGIAEGNLRNWLRQAKADEGSGPKGHLTSDEKLELAALRKENKELRMEKEILRKATVFFAKQQM